MQLHQEYLSSYYISGIPHVVIVLFLLQLSIGVFKTYGVLGALAKLDGFS